MGGRFVLKASGSQFSFSLRASGNHEVLGTSETYSSATMRDGGIAAVKANAPAAVVDDQTLE